MIELPTERSVVETYNPKLLVIFGKPKSGKSSFVAAIDDNLIIDLEDGYRALSVMKVQARTAKDMQEIRDAILKKGKELKRAPYRFITIDNATRLEEMSIPLAAELYRQTPMGSGWGLMTDAKGMPVKDPKTGKVMVDPKADVRQLANGAGWLYMRKAIRQLVDMFKPLCESLILVCHVKDKQIKKNGEEMSEMAVDLAGKSADIICGEADAVGYLYREGNRTYLSFEGGDNTIREARSPHLRGKKLIVAESNEDNEVVFNTSEVFINKQ